MRHGWLLWLALAAAACLPPLDVKPILALMVSCVFMAMWLAFNVSLKTMVQSAIFMALDVFFREMGARNQYKVPPEGSPVIFVCAPHHNQFIDPFVVARCCGRTDTAFLTAAKTMRLRILGCLARNLGSIPVERPQDVARRGEGRVWISPEDGVSVQGRRTSFTTQAREGDSLAIGSASATIAEVVSDESLRLAKPLAPAGPTADWREYKLVPRIEHASMFAAVHAALDAGRAVGIFPEGGSHDQPSLLPLKAGIAIMALGALAKHRRLQLKLVPVGLNYFSGHRFRSRVFLDIGEPLEVPADLVELYCAGGEARANATALLMELIEKSFAAVTVSAPDYDTLEFFWTLRRLVKTGSGPMSLSEQIEFARRFSAGYDQPTADGCALRDTAAVKRVRELTSAYNAALKSYGIRDYQVVHVMGEITRAKAARLLCVRVLLLLVFAMCFLPMYVLGLPLLVLTRTIAMVKANQAVRSSKVKIHGRDVMGTWKVLVALVALPALWVFYTAVTCAASFYYFSDPWDLETCLVFFFALPFLFYGAIIAGERTVMIAKSLPVLAMCLLDPKHRWQMVEQRQELMDAMLGLADEQGWHVPPPHLRRSKSNSGGGSERGASPSGLRTTAGQAEARGASPTPGRGEEALALP